jgi:hypothetical protein
MADFRDFDDVAAWVREQPGDPVAVLDQAIGTDRFSGRNRTLAVRYRDKLMEEVIQAEGERRERLAAVERELRAREVTCAEMSAQAAVDSANHAAASARWAKWALLVSGVALLVSVGPQIGRLIKAL